MVFLVFLGFLNGFWRFWGGGFGFFRICGFSRWFCSPLEGEPLCDSFAGRRRLFSVYHIAYNLQQKGVFGAIVWICTNSLTNPEYVWFPHRILLKGSIWSFSLTLFEFLIKPCWKGCIWSYNLHMFNLSSNPEYVWCPHHNFLIESYWRARIRSHSLNIFNFLTKSWTCLTSESKPEQIKYPCQLLLKRMYSEP